MKFVAAILTAFFVAAEAKSKTVRVNREELLRKATKVTDRSLVGDRKLDGYSQISADHSIQFNSCISLTTEPADDDIFYSDNNVAYAQSGNIVSEKSYVLFNVCETDYCDYKGDDNLYMIDLQTYLGITIPYLPTRKQMYCYACEDSQEYCEKEKQKEQEQNMYDAQDYYEQEVDEEVNQYQDADEGYEYEEEDQQAAQQAYDGNRRLQNNWYGNKQFNWYGNNSNEPKTVETVTCGKCEEYGCFGDDYMQEDANQYQQYDANQYQEYDDAYQQNDANQNEYQAYDAAQNEIDEDEIAEFVMGLTGCLESGADWNDEALYSAFICNAEGTGVEIGMFLDEECTIYTNLVSFLDVGNQNAQNGGDDTLSLAYAAQEVVSYPFTHDLDCADTFTYATPWGTYHNQGSYYNSGDNAASRYCQNLLKNNVMKLDDCDGDGEVDQYNYYPEEQEDEVDDQYYAYDFYSYMLSQEQVNYYPIAVCQVIKSLEGEYVPVYDGDAGNVFDYSYRETYSPRSRSLDVLSIIGAIVVALAALGVIGYAFFLICRKIATGCYGVNFDHLSWKPDPKKEKLVINDAEVTPAPSPAHTIKETLSTIKETLGINSKSESTPVPTSTLAADAAVDESEPTPALSGGETAKIA